jgi:alpha-L-arabinofuranosidase
MKIKNITCLLFAPVVFSVVRGRAQSTATVTIQANLPGASISSNLFGVFFEEINFAGEGGLYAEMVRNRALGNSANPDYWTLVTQGTASGQMSVDTSRPLNTNSVRSLKLTMLSGAGSVGAGNAGFFGMNLQSGSNYDLSFYACATNGFTGQLSARLESSNGGTAYAQTSFSGLTANWQRFTASLIPSATDTNARLVLSITNAGTVWLDVVSLFPQATFHNHTNGLRADLANMVAAVKPSFLRYPGGNFIESNTITNAVRWKKTVGDIALRPGHLNDAWGYWSTDGFGLHEFLLLCEDLGMEPLYGINCGLMLGYNGSANNTVPLNQMGPWVQDALDLIQYANGDTNTTWGAQRAANGHPAPFSLKYIEIGNENGGSFYEPRYALFYDAIKSNYPAMHLISPVWGSPSIPTSRPVEIMDEHYYSSAGTFAGYASKYDSYNRSGPKVFVGEYAVTSGFGTLGNLTSALGEAAFMTAMERNSDLVLMASYAPLFNNVNSTQWHPDAINFDSSRVLGTPSYYVQQMFGQNRGNFVLPATVSVSGNPLYVSCSLVSSSGQVLVKAVNVNGTSIAATFNVNGASSVAASATLIQLASGSATNENSLASPTNVSPVTSTFASAGTNFTVTLPAYSFSIFKLQASGFNAVTNLLLQVASPLNVGQESQSAALAQLSGQAGPVSLAGNYGVAYSSANTNIAVVNPGGLVTGISPGTTGITATYDNLSVTQPVQVVAAGPTMLIHRYSFNDGTANDSVGTANGTFFNTSGSASIASGQLNLVGSSGDYVDLGPGIITATNISNGALTFEAWATFNAVNGAWARLFDFGNISGSSGGNYIFMTPNTAANGGSGRVAVTDTMPGNTGEALVNIANLLGRTNIYVAVVFNPFPERQFLGLYTNGVLAASTSTGTKSIASINNVYSFLGRSLWSGDAWLRGSINEFRIHNGELDKYQIAASFQAGPDQTNYSAGAPTSFAVDAGIMPLAVSVTRQAAGYLNFTSATSVNVTGDPNLTFSSDNSSVFTVTAAGLITATGVGAANLTGVFNYVTWSNTNIYTNSLAVTVYRDQRPVLAHRYSFSESSGTTTADSVGGSAWNGTLSRGGTFGGGQLALAASGQQYVQLPSGILSNYTAVTIETWVTFPDQLPVNCFFFGFGNTNGSSGSNYIFCAPLAGRIAITPSAGGAEQNAYGGVDFSFHTNFHLVAVFDPPAGYIAIYTNGVLAGINNSVTAQFSSVNNVFSYIGRSLYTADPYPDFTLDEFRIYNGVLHPDEIAATQAMGPGQVLSTAPPILAGSIASGLLTLAWPVASAGFNLQSRTNLVLDTWTALSSPTPQIVGSQWQIAVPLSATSRYFRLQK